MDGDQTTAVTRVEIERIEDVHDIVKVYRFGVAAPQEDIPMNAAEEYHV